MSREIKRRNTYLSSPIVLDPPPLTLRLAVCTTHGDTRAAGAGREGGGGGV